MIDHFGRTIEYLRISVTDLCNMRCRYCMPAEGVEKRSHVQNMTEEELCLAMQAAASLGIRKIRITGGEPLVKPNIIRICEAAAAIDGIEEVCLTTNGTLLPRYAKDLKAAGVKRLNISLDTLDEEKYRFITRNGDFQTAWEGIETAIETGFEKIKINSVLIGGFNSDEIVRLAALTIDQDIDVRFIEMMPMYDSGDFGPEAFIPNTVVLDALPELKAEGTSGVSKIYRLPGARGSVGLISPVSAHFCSTCNRIRLTSDGKLKPCLHAPLEFSLKGKDLEGMKQTFREAVLGKPQWHGELSYENRSKSGRNMNRIGG